MTNKEAIAMIRNDIKLHHDYLSGEYRKALGMAIKALEAQDWIPCSERLPEKDGDYLVTYEKGYASDYGLDPIGIAPFEVDCEGFGFWQEDFDMYTLGSLGTDWVDINVIAWMEKPEPYKEGGVV